MALDLKWFKSLEWGQPYQQSKHGVWASGSLVQRKECHHLAPADTSILLQRACAWRDATVNLHKHLCRSINVYGRQKKKQNPPQHFAYLHVKWVFKVLERIEKKEYTCVFYLFFFWGPFWVIGVKTSLSAQTERATCARRRKRRTSAWQHLLEEPTAFAEDRQQSHISRSIFAQIIEQSVLQSLHGPAREWGSLRVCVCVCARFV